MANLFAHSILHGPYSPKPHNFPIAHPYRANLSQTMTWNPGIAEIKVKINRSRVHTFLQVPNSPIDQKLKIGSENQEGHQKWIVT